MGLGRTNRVKTVFLSLLNLPEREGWPQVTVEGNGTMDTMRELTDDEVDAVSGGDNNNTNNSNNPPATATGGQVGNNNANNNPPVTAQN